LQRFGLDTTMGFPGMQAIMANIQRFDCIQENASFTRKRTKG
jgi:hypothetical protein